MRSKSKTCALVVAALSVAFVGACGATTTVEITTEGGLLFVQSAQAATSSGNRITLTGVAPNTVYFSDRPERVTGHMTTQVFVDGWDSGDDSFAVDPPNADVDCLSGDTQTNVVVVLSEPDYDASAATLTYTAVPLEGTLPDSCDAISLFIDNNMECDAFCGICKNESEHSMECKLCNSPMCD